MKLCLCMCVCARACACVSVRKGARVHVLTCMCCKNVAERGFGFYV